MSEEKEEGEAVKDGVNINEIEYEKYVHTLSISFVCLIHLIQIIPIRWNFFRFRKGLPHEWLTV
jgi:hypothetical protein